MPYHIKHNMGKHHSIKTREVTSKRMIKDWADKTSSYNSIDIRRTHSISQSRIMVERLKKQPNNVYSRTMKGWREFGNGKKYYFRSKWEINYAYYLEFLKKYKKIKDWTYEDDTFWFDKIKRGVRSYTPDFKIFNNDLSIEYHEVKGWMDNKSKTKLKRMKKYYPDIKIILIEEEQYNALKKNEKLFNWE